MTLLISGWGGKWKIIYLFSPREDTISDLTPIKLIIGCSVIIVFMCKQNTVVLVITTAGSSLLVVHLGYHADPFKELSS
jgi:hypothetical protein